MKLMLAALVATSIIAIVAAVFAIWPVVADAPWEDDPPAIVQPVDRTGEIRCQGALDMRIALINQGYPASHRFVADSEREIDHFC